MQKEIYVLKASGDRELFDEEKLRRSLEKAGSSASEVDQVVSHVRGELEENMTTDHIYRHAFSFLKRLKNPKVMGRYSLRRALIDLGPTGFPFEKFLAQLFKRKGFEAVTNQVVRGRCVSHEMDVVAYNESKLLMVESKFHNRLGEKSDLKIVLYVKARFDDLLEQTFEYGTRRQLDEGWLITNTKFTENAIRYGRCAGLRMAGWNYPEKGNIRDMIEDVGLQPITCLSTLSGADTQLLLNKGMVACRQVIESKSELTSLGLSVAKVQSILSEAELICSI